MKVTHIRGLEVEAGAGAWERGSRDSTVRYVRLRQWEDSVGFGVSSGSALRLEA